MLHLTLPHYIPSFTTPHTIHSKQYSFSFDIGAVSNYTFPHSKTDIVLMQLCYTLLSPQITPRDSHTKIIGTKSMAEKIVATRNDWLQITTKKRATEKKSSVLKIITAGSCQSISGILEKHHQRIFIFGEK